ncbi:fungal pheromone STE3G-protein-coupled receptor, partial [Coniophora puteana RWD-64-598 SS2]
MSTADTNCGVLQICLIAWNTGSVLYIMWTSVMCLTIAVNAAMWNGNVTDWAPAWCEISSRLAIGGEVALPVATLCINRRLYQILTLQYQRNCAACVVATDTFICLCIPAVCVVLYYVAQVNRYLLVEDFGCCPADGKYGASVLLVGVWPLVASIVSSIY